MRQMYVLSFHEFQTDVDANILADDEVACFRHAVPGETEVLAVDLTADGDACAGVTPGIFDDAAEFGIEADGFRHTMDGQFAIYLIGAVVVNVLIFGGREFYLGKFRRIEEIGRFQMTIALVGSGSDRIDVRGEGDL